MAKSTAVYIKVNSKRQFADDLQKKIWNYFSSNTQVGDVVWVDLKATHPLRTEAQHRYYFMYLGVIAKETGTEVEELHEIFKTMFLKVTKIEYETRDGTILHTLKYPSTKELTIKEFSEFIKKIEAESGVPAPDTSTFGLDKYIEQYERSQR